MSKVASLRTSAEVTWCPGCGNFSILNSVLKVFDELRAEINLNRFVLVSGIGCHGKIVDYINLNSFYSIHGRTSPSQRG
jgi:2-oxoglutarate ferredoxin oxidoreductase subunit beta